ncbi:hypothetical protein TNCV_4009021 [Trichonephila clavipes]|nr:hypothetical protein TNCV_4009021 [Trichonephila clavipes]
MRSEARDGKCNMCTCVSDHAVGSLVVRASDSRPEGLGSMPAATKHLRSTHGACSLNQWVRSLVGLITSAGTGEYFPPLQSTCRNCGGGDRGRRYPSSLRGISPS